MEITVLENTKKRLVFTFIGATHTICNSLKDELWNDKNIVAAAYNVDHPLVSQPKFVVETDGKEEPVKAVSSAISRLKKSNKDLNSALSKLKL